LTGHTKNEQKHFILYVTHIPGSIFKISTS